MPLPIHKNQPWDAQPARLPDTAITQSEDALAGEQQRQSPNFTHQQTSDRRSLSLPARQPSPASPAAGSCAMAGSAPLPSVAHFLEDSSGISPGSSTTNYSPRTKTCLYKTEVCCSWKKTGRCRYGSKCQFAHGEEELKPVNRHPKYKTEVCRSFAQTGECRYGRRCRFIHPDGSETTNSNASPDSSMELPFSVPAPLHEMTHPSEGFAHPPSTDLSRQLSAYLALLNPDQGHPYPNPYPPINPQHPSELLMHAVQQQQHDAAVAMLQSNSSLDHLNSNFAPNYFPSDSTSMLSQPPLTYGTETNLPMAYSDASMLSAHSMANSLAASDWDAQISQSSHMAQVSQNSHMAQMGQAAQYSPELLSLLAANQIPAVGNSAFSTLPNQAIDGQMLNWDCTNHTPWGNSF